ncbi:MAG: hypothetical protein ISS41_04670 [Candidatus Aminicenantes bacterium]|nr:hypothetical protein [Candidatus Aminicenantes bacterium]
MDEATIEDLAFLNRSLRVSGEAGHRVCLNSGQWIQKTRNFCPSKINILILRRPAGKKNRLKAKRAWFTK